MTDGKQPTPETLPTDAEQAAPETEGAETDQAAAVITPFTPPVRKAAAVWPMAVACLALGCVIGFAVHMTMVPVRGGARSGTQGQRQGSGEGQAGPGQRRLRLQDTMADAPPSAKVGAATLARKPGIALGRLVVLLSVFQQAQGMGLTDVQLARARDILADLDMATELAPEEAGRRVQALAGILTPVQKTALARLLPSRGRATEVERRPFLTARNIIALDYLLGRKPREIRDEEPASLEQRLNGAGQGAGARSGLVGATQDR